MMTDPKHVPEESVTGTDITAVRYDVTEDGVDRVEVADVAGDFTFRPGDQVQRQRHEEWLTDRGLPTFYAGHPTTVERWITEEEQSRA